MKKKILIVDDNPANVKVLQASLANADFEHLIANTGERAAMITERAKPDLILLDINLPGMNGFETCLKIKENQELKQIPIIFLSALDDSESKVKGFAVGGVDYITKPFNRDEVISRVNTHLKIAHLTQELEVQNSELNDALEEVRTIQNELETVNDMLIQSIEYAKRIQDSILPHPNEFNTVFKDFFIEYHPKNWVSGDFYWGKKVGKNIILVGADCTGHGVPGAFMSLIGVTVISLLVNVQGFIRPAQILEQLDSEVQRLLRNTYNYSEQINDGMDLAIVKINQETLMMEYSSANRPIIHIRNGNIQKLDADRQSVGRKLFEKKDFTHREFQLEENDLLYLFTDGITDQFGTEEQVKSGSRKFQFKRLFQLLNEIHHLELKHQGTLITQAITEWRGYLEQTDDIMMIGIRI